MPPSSPTPPLPSLHAHDDQRESEERDGQGTSDHQRAGSEPTTISPVPDDDDDDDDDDGDDAPGYFHLDRVQHIKATDFGSFVSTILTRQHESTTVSQPLLRSVFLLASSFLLTDTFTQSDPQLGIRTWDAGISALVDLVLVLHRRGELELETLSCASRACSECWSAAGNWRGLDRSRVRLRDLGSRLKKILDPNEKTYKGGCVYAP